MRGFLLLLLLLLLAACTTPTHVDRDSVSLEYNNMIYGKPYVQGLANEKCAEFKRRAVLEDESTGRAPDLSVATFRCID